MNARDPHAPRCLLQPPGQRRRTENFTEVKPSPEEQRLRTTQDFIGDRILRPLGMKDTFSYPPTDKIARIAMVYVQKDGKLAD